MNMNMKLIVMLIEAYGVTSPALTGLYLIYHL